MEKRLVAPVIITVCIVCFFVFIAIVGFFIMSEISLLGTAILLAVALAAIGIHVFILAERIKEIRSGEEDDLSKY